ncbi:MAG: hypothetical protein M3137_16095 [Actinomycetota bacterium]|nr:hypothetical protein [Actinomycetota bacterium]
MATSRCCREMLRLAGGLFLLVFVVGCGGSPRHPAQLSSLTAHPSAVPEIGYSTSNGSFVIGLDGSNPHTLSTGLPFTGAADPRSPQPVTGKIVISPNGTREAYWRDGDQPSESRSSETVGVWTADSNGAGAHRIWSAPSNYAAVRTADPDNPVPRWSPAGTELAIIVSRTPYAYGILVMHANGSGAHYLTRTSPGPESAGPLTWSPDGKELAYVGFHNGSSIVAVPAAGGGARVVADLGRVGRPTSLSWSPDGQTILAPVGVDGTPMTNLEAYPAAGGNGSLVYRAPGLLAAFYSPDGKHIVFTSDLAGTGVQGGPTGIRVANADGTGVTVVPNTTAINSSIDLTGWFQVSAPPGPVAHSSGYWVAGSDGRVASFGGGYDGQRTLDPVQHPGQPATSLRQLKAPVTAITATAGVAAEVIDGVAGGGYQMVAADGEVIIAGNGERINATIEKLPDAFGGHQGAPIVALCEHSFVSSDGAIYPAVAYAPYAASEPTATIAHLTAPIVGAACAHGPIVVAADGTVYGATGPNPNTLQSNPIGLLYAVPGITAPIVGVTSDRATGGYWLVGQDGNVYGVNAPLQGSLRGQHLAARIVGIAADDATGGYWVVTADGAVHGFNAPIERHTGGPNVTANAIGIAAVPLPSSESNSF